MTAFNKVVGHLKEEITYERVMQTEWMGWPAHMVDYDPLDFLYWQKEKTKSQSRLRSIIRKAKQKTATTI